MASSSSTGDAALLSTEGLTKSFGSFKACDGIDLSIAGGEIHALLGENGAGKSTLVKMLFGVLEPSAGAIRWRGDPVAIRSPAAARRTGIGMVFQHFSLFEALTVAENIALSLDDAVPIERIAKEAARLSREYGLPLDPNAHVADLSVGERQRIEIVRTLLQKPELIILDEPTSVLTPQEADRLFETLEQLRGEGRAILYISHRLEEVRRICDRATVLRHGKVTGACDPRRETVGSLAGMMVGGEVEGIADSGLSPGEAVLVETRALSVPAQTPFSISLEDVTLAVRSGEILAIAGVAGNGQSELFDVLSGETLVADAAAVRIDGRDAGRLSISARRLLGAGFVPEERNGHGAVGSLALSQNVMLSRHASDSRAYLAGGPVRMLKEGSVRETARRIVAAMDVRKSGEDPQASSLSGGNLQKFIVGRELDRKPRVLVVNQPTWGVDAGAAARIRQALIERAREGAAVLVISQDLDEIFEIATRIAVISGGRLSKAEPSATMTRERIGRLMGGIQGVDEGTELADAS
ncbi:ABC transporter ATP-binding protein [Pararhizobium mangrovi]|uniref:ABC transporter ATP-binding protein n=1 Tax=Pararhizobium mangrovi TaxID=2590452 RepID=A0A506TZQ3_9HYPH|nr:ABC transporter ATP-binding protein [Pararhizobium mangrovi]TPW26786.1 ABC transporter ATP-binding protein [Pararhizobium mangrovi]